MTSENDQQHGVHLLATNTQHGTIVGVGQVRETYCVKLTTEAGKLELSASPQLAEQAARLLGCDTRATVRSRWDADTDTESDLELLGLEPWTRSSLLDAMRDVRRDLEESGIHVDGAAMERELFGDDA
jgi:hypothetical protein